MEPLAHPDRVVRGTSGGCNLLAAGKHTQAVIRGVAERGVRIGERTDANNPPWITTQVVTGGFRTGRHLAGGPELPHERALISRHAIPAGPAGVTRRGSINLWCTETPEGRAWLLDLSRSGFYSVRSAEEGCLLAVAVLEDAGVPAGDIVDEVVPWFNRLRFFPEPADSPPLDGSTSSVQTVRNLLSKSADRLRRFRGKLKANQTHKAVVNSVYLPTYMAVIEESRAFCSWWRDEAHATGDLELNVTHLATMRACLELHGFRRRERRSCLHQLFEALDVAAEHGRQTRLSFVEHIERLVDAAHTKWAHRDFNAGAADLSPRRQVFFIQLQGMVEELNLNKDPECGLSPDRVADMSSRFPLLKTCIQRLTLGTFGELARAGLLPSSEALASHCRARAVSERTASFAPGPARTLAQQILHAFAARRSQLLLNLASQVRVGELPWFTALNDASRRGAFRGTTAGLVTVSPVATEIFGVHMRFFAGTQVPNKLVEVLGRYLGCFGLVKELAADIFMGSLVKTFGAQAKQREEILGPGTPYGAYYAAVLVEFPPGADSRRVDISELGLECGGFGHATVVENGIAIERVATATTHNLLHLLVALEMDKDVELLTAAARVALASLLASLTPKQSDYKFLRDESRRAAASCRSLMVVVSLLKRLGKVPPALVQSMTAGASQLPEQRATVMVDVCAAVEGRVTTGQPLMGWSPSGEKHPFFSSGKKRKA